MAKSRHWTEQVADRVEQQVRRHKGAGATIVCASGVSPSGPIHLGNLRECGSDTCPRLPTLFLSIGKERARKLLTPLDE